LINYKRDLHIFDVDVDMDIGIVMLMLMLMLGRLVGVNVS